MQRRANHFLTAFLVFAVFLKFKYYIVNVIHYAYMFLILPNLGLVRLLNYVPRGENVMYIFIFLKSLGVNTCMVDTCSFIIYVSGVVYSKTLLSS